MTALPRSVRGLLIGLRTHVTYLSRSPLELLLAVTLPIAYGTLAIFLFGVHDHPQRLTQAAVGAGLMGMWTSVLFGSGAAVQDHRALGVLELLVAAPRRLFLTLLPITLASSIVGVYSIVAVLVWSTLLFGVTPSLAHPWLFLAALPTCVMALGVMGLLLAATFVLARNANALANALDYPVWLLSGMLTPISVLPLWSRPLSWALPTTWGAAAVNSAVDGSASATLTAIGGAFVIGPVYLGLAMAALTVVERRARSAATLALA